MERGGSQSNRCLLGWAVGLGVFFFLNYQFSDSLGGAVVGALSGCIVGLSCQHWLKGVSRAGNPDSASIRTTIVWSLGLALAGGLGRYLGPAWYVSGLQVVGYVLAYGISGAAGGLLAGLVWMLQFQSEADEPETSRFALGLACMAASLGIALGIQTTIAVIGISLLLSVPPFMFSLSHLPAMSVHALSGLAAGALMFLMSHFCLSRLGLLEKS
jgi:hypothetical protein